MKPWSRLIQHPPDLCLHTTEGSTVLGDAYKRWEFPPNFACGDDHIVQLFPLGYASEAVDSKDGYLLQVELAYRVANFAATKIYLPPPSTLYPLVALTAFLHQHGHIRTGLQRPSATWPTALDRLPAATDQYYRRSDGTWGRPGVYGHVEIPDDEHWDPGSFDYPVFFEMVRAVLEGDDMRLEDYYDGWDRYKQARKEQGTDPGPPPENMTNDDRRKGWSHARDAFQHPKLTG